MGRPGTRGSLSAGPGSGNALRRGRGRCRGQGDHDAAVDLDGAGGAVPGDGALLEVAAATAGDVVLVAGRVAQFGPFPAHARPFVTDGAEYPVGAGAG